MSDRSVNSICDTCGIALKAHLSLCSKIPRKSIKRCWNSDARQTPPCESNHPSRKRYRTEVTNFQNSPSVFSRLSMPGRSGRNSQEYFNADAARNTPRRKRSKSEIINFKNARVNSPSFLNRLSVNGSSGRSSSPGHSNADAWITDSIAEKPTGNKSYGGWLTKRTKGPYLGSYQLLGDSLLVRFADQILKSRAVIGENGKFCNGHCVSGQTIMDLNQSLSKDFTTSDVLVLIGTNDFLRRSSLNVMKKHVEKLLDFLSYCAEKIVLLTLPPIPRLENTLGYWSQWESYNKWLQSLDNGKAVRVIDVAPLFMLSPQSPDMETFESYMGYGDKRRVDHIHLNRLGLQRLHCELKKQLSID